MANTKSAAKSARKNIRRRTINTGVISALKTGQKKFRAALSAGGDSAKEEFSKLSSALDKAAKRGIIHRNAADRKKSRINKALTKAKA